MILGMKYRFLKHSAFLFDVVSLCNTHPEIIFLISSIVYYDFIMSIVIRSFA